MSQIFAVLSAEALRRDLLSALHDNWKKKTQHNVVETKHEKSQFHSFFVPFFTSWILYKFYLS